MGDVVAAALPEPTAMVLASVSASGRPRARTILLKSYDAAGFTFYTNRTSRKGTELAEVPRACLLFPWHAIYRQVIIEGTVTPLSAADSQPYFHSRPRGSSWRTAMPNWRHAGQRERRSRCRSSGAGTGLCRRSSSSGTAG